MSNAKSSILHICGRDNIRELRDQILRLHGYEVTSTLSPHDAPHLFGKRVYSLVLIDVDGDGCIPDAEKLCEEIRKEHPEQPVAFVCNHRVAIHSDCPDEVIRSEFNPDALVKGVQQIAG